MSEPLLAIRDLRVVFTADEGQIEAVAGVSFDVSPNRTVAVVGESGSGKTVISQAILGILPANATDRQRARCFFTRPGNSGAGHGSGRDLSPRTNCRSARKCAARASRSSSRSP